MTEQEQAKFWIEKTKKILQEEQRKERILQTFKKTFGFLPDKVDFDFDGLLFAYSEIIPYQDFFIENKKVKIVKFTIRETKKDEKENFFKSVNSYVWKKTIENFEIEITIKTE